MWKTQYLIWLLSVSWHLCTKTQLLAFQVNHFEMWRFGGLCLSTTCLISFDLVSSCWILFGPCLALRFASWKFVDLQNYVRRALPSISKHGFQFDGGSTRHDPLERLAEVLEAGRPWAAPLKTINLLRQLLILVAALWILGVTIRNRGRLEKGDDY